MQPISPLVAAFSKLTPWTYNGLISQLRFIAFSIPKLSKASCICTFLLLESPCLSKNQDIRNIKTVFHKSKKIKTECENRIYFPRIHLLVLLVISFYTDTLPCTTNHFRSCMCIFSSIKGADNGVLTFYTNKDQTLLSTVSMTSFFVCFVFFGGFC